MTLGPQFDPQYGDGLYHGTFRNIEGGHVLPAVRTTHKRTNFGLGDPHKAYATENEHTAWDLATSARPHDGTVPGRVRVHEVEPNSEMSLGNYHPDSLHYRGENLSEWTAPKFKIKGTRDIKPGHQGTFNLNWNQFREHPEASAYSDAFNHPTDEDVADGHQGGKMYNETLKRVYGSGGLEDLENSKPTKLASGPEQGRLF